MPRQQKSNADKYSNLAVDLISHVQEIHSLPPLDQKWNELLQILTEAVRDLDAERLSEEFFNSFRVILQIGMEATKERRSMLATHAHLKTYFRLEGAARSSCFVFLKPQSKAGLG